MAKLRKGVMVQTAAVSQNGDKGEAAVVVAGDGLLSLRHSSPVRNRDKINLLIMFCIYIYRLLFIYAKARV